MMAMDERIAQHCKDGWAVVWMGEDKTILSRREQPSTLFWGIITLVTGGFGAILWALAVLTAGTKTMVIEERDKGR